MLGPLYPRVAAPVVGDLDVSLARDAAFFVRGSRLLARSRWLRLRFYSMKTFISERIIVADFFRHQRTAELLHLPEA